MKLNYYLSSLTRIKLKKNDRPKVMSYNIRCDVDKDEKDFTVRAFLFTTMLGSIVCVIFALLVFVFKEQIIMFFRSEEEIVSIGKRGLMFYTLSIPLMAFSTFVNQMYQGLGFKVRATILASCRQGIFYIPLIFLLPYKFGLNGILAVQSMSDILTCLISIPFIIFFFNHYLNTTSVEEDAYLL